LQELEKMNEVLVEMARALNELELGLAGALNISDVMDALIINLSLNQVPNLWLKICSQVGPTGPYNRKNLGNWFVDLLARRKQLQTWGVDNALQLPPSIWIAGLFNPMGFITATMQVTARNKSLPLDAMAVHTEVTDKDAPQLDSQPSDGAYIHGYFMEGARWDRANNVIAESRPKELHPPMPVVHVLGVTSDKVVKEGVYECPVYNTSIRGPTFVFVALLRTKDPPHKWTLAAACLLSQPDA